MENLILKDASDEQLEAIIRKAENTHISGSQFERANIELEIRRKKELFDLQKNAITTIKTKLDGIINVLTKIIDKPLLAIAVAGAGAVLIGVLINIATSVLLKILRL